MTCHVDADESFCDDLAKYGFHRFEGLSRRNPVLLNIYERKLSCNYFEESTVVHSCCTL